VSAPTVRNVLAAVARRAPSEKGAEWDPVGLQLGDPASPVHQIAACHEVTERVVNALEESPPDLLVSYHPLLFRATRRLVAGPTPEGRALRLARAGIALACVHTAFDVAPGGAADALAESLGLVDVRGFGPLWGRPSSKLVTFVPEGDADRLLDAVVEAGAGRIGNYTHCSFRSEGTGTFYAGEGTDPTVGRAGSLNREPEVRLEFVAPDERLSEVVAAMLAAHPYEEPAYDVYARRGDAGTIGRVGRLEPALRLSDLRERVSAALGAAVVRLAGDPDATVERATVVPGAGSDFVDAARGTGAGVLVTGDVSHHRAREALDRGLAVLDPGHVATERPGIARLEQWLEEVGVPVRSLRALGPDPWEGGGSGAR
jgi:dinuclear metal center YbgI/SA1388 family protein